MVVCSLLPKSVREEERRGREEREEREEEKRQRKMHRIHHHPPSHSGQAKFSLPSPFPELLWG